MAAVAGRRQSTLELVKSIEDKGFSGIFCPSFGDAMSLCLSIAHVTERVSSFGEMRKPSAQVAKDVAKMIKNYLSSDAVVGRNLADQLLLPMALAGGGSMLASAPSNHVTTNIAVIESFLPVKFKVTEQEKGNALITISGN